MGKVLPSRAKFTGGFLPLKGMQTKYEIITIELFVFTVFLS